LHLSAPAEIAGAGKNCADSVRRASNPTSLLCPIAHKSVSREVDSRHIGISVTRLLRKVFTAIFGACHWRARTMKLEDKCTAELYAAMPGAPQPPMLDHQLMWGDVMGNEHWEFCAAIVRLILKTARTDAR
jgi:hypothetical protein